MSIKDEKTQFWLLLIILALSVGLLYYAFTTLGRVE